MVEGCIGDRNDVKEEKIAEESKRNDEGEEER
jgi:hypothetical protein